MRRAAVVVWLGAAMLALVGCGGGSSSGSGGHGGRAGATGAGGSAGTRGSGGATGTGGASVTGGAGGTSGGLPACAVTTRPADPSDPTADGGYSEPYRPICNDIVPTGPWVVPEVFTWGDAGAVADGGVPEAPAGGVVLDGDYDLVRILFAGPVTTTYSTRRTFRVFGGGTYIERAVQTMDPTVDGGMTDIWYDTTEAPSGTSFGSQSVCAPVAATDAYTASGEILTLFVYVHTVQEPSPVGIDIYRRTCTRP